GRCDHAHRGSRALLGQALQSAGSSVTHIDGGAADEGDIAEAMARHLPTWSQGRPVLVVLDDLHVADAETLEAVADLAGWCRAAPMLVIATFRSDAAHPTPAAPRGSKASQLALGPLASDAVGHICELYATEPWSADDIDRVHELTGGVPLLVHEQASEWARERAGRRMAEATDRVAASRRRLLASRGEVADGVEGIQQLLEQRRAQLAGRQAQLQATAVAALAGCPYKGLARFEESDAASFFGRERLVAELVARLAGARILAVVGPSGSGKSSLIRAGLLPALATGVLPGTQPWRSAILCPGPRPYRELARRLHELGGPEDGPRVVFVDQFEETFSAGADRREQDEFVTRLVDVTDQPDTAVVLAVRADHLDRCTMFAELADRLDGNDVLVGPMRDSELRRTVELPAQRAGLEIEGGLVELIVSEIAGRAGALPLLSTALAETWERREGRVLTLGGYRAAGGVNGALARMAEDAYAGLPAGPRDATRRLLLRLCDSGEGGDLTLRRRLPLDEAIDEDDTDAHAALETLADRRLLTIDSDSVEVAHEALLREWPRLRTWLDEDVQGRRLHRRLHDAARSWDATDHDASELYRGTRLGAAADWAAHHGDELSQTERAFLDASQAQSDQELTDARRQAAARARSNRRLRSLLAAAAIFLVGALAAGLVAVGQRDRAERAGDVATARELAAAANVNVDVDPERSILLALAAVERARTDGGASVLPEAEEALHRAVTGSRVELRVPGVGGRVDWSPDGTVFATEGPENSGMVDIRDARTGESVRSFHGHDGDITDVAFNHDGTLLATTGTDAAARIWDPATGEMIHTIRMPVSDGFSATGPSFSRDGSLFAAAFAPVFAPGRGVVKVVDLATGRIAREVSSVAIPKDTIFDPAGTRLAITSWNGPTATLVDITSGNPVLALEGHLLYGIMDIDWSPDGERIATAGFDGSARVFDAQTGGQHLAILGTGGHIYSIDWSPDGTRLVGGKSDGTANVWQVTGGGAREQMTLTAQDTRKGVTGVAFSPDGTHVLTGDAGITAARIWDVGIAGDAEVANIPAVAVTAGAVDFSSDGRQLVATSKAGSVTVWDTPSVTPVRTLGAPSPSSSALGAAPGYDAPLASGAEVFSLDVSPDGRLVAAVRFDGTVRVWDVETGRDAFIVDAGPLQPPYGTVTWSPEGDVLAVTTNDGTTGRATVIDRSGRVLAVHQEEFGVALSGLTFTPDGEQLVTARMPTGPPTPDAGGVVTWDWRSGDVEPIIDTPAAFALASPTGRLVATTSQQGTLTGSGGPVDVWDPAAGRRVATLAGSGGAVLDVAFSADGSRLATSGQDGTVRIWDAASGEELLVLRGHYPAFSVAFSPDGSQLASVGSNGVVRVWALDLAELVQIAEDELTRTLTDEECQQYLHVQRCP
ncbi:MAG TPA: hypothetical protein VKD21_18645, partial [Acidimicrobiales bacterium]|nr:hypothetical protein [Acidimicrobiales bacterium]